MSKPKVIVWDIETSHNISANFGFFNTSIPLDNILQEWYIISVAWKELGKKKVKAVSVLDDVERFKADPNDDYHVVKTMYEILSDADAIIHHFGDNFDIKKLNARLIYHGFDPLPPIIQIDTHKICKNKFKFNSNRLDYVGKYLGLGGKIETEKGLWLRCLAGDKKAIREMVKYNKQDVDLLEAVYFKIAPYAKAAQLNHNHFTKEYVCPSCGGTHLQKRGFRMTRVTKYQRFQCQECGHWSSANILADGTLGKLR